MNWKPSTCGMPRSATTTSGTSASRLLSASAADARCVTRAPAASQDLGHQRQGIRLVVDGEHVHAAQIRTGDLAAVALGSRMHARAILADRMHDHQRNLQPERRPLIDARRSTTSIVPPCISISCRAIDRPRPSPPRSRAMPAVRLAESLEHVRQELGRDADAGVADGDFQVRVDALEPDLHLAAAVGELHRIRQQIPQHLLQAFRIA